MFSAVRMGPVVSERELCEIDKVPIVRYYSELVNHM